MTNQRALGAARLIAAHFRQRLAFAKRSLVDAQRDVSLFEIELGRAEEIIAALEAVPATGGAEA